MPGDLRQLLHTAAGSGRPAPADLFDRLARRRRRRQVTRGVLVATGAAAAVVALALGAGLLQDGPEHVVPADAPTRWEELPPSPLSARHRSLAVPLGDSRVLVVGGFTNLMCSPSASCAGPRPVARSDGASYDLTTRQWEAIAPAPEPLAGHLRPAVVSGRVHVLTEAGHHLAYDPAADRWTMLPAPANAKHRGLVAAGTTLVAGLVGDYAGEIQTPLADVAYDPEGRAWTTLPTDPLLPVSGAGRDLVWTGTELVSLGSAPRVDTTDFPHLRASAFNLQTGTWRTLMQAEQLMFESGWTFDGHRIINPSRTSADGGDTNPWPRELHAGGILDPATGTWSLLPATPDPTFHLGLFSVGVSGTRFKGAGDILFDAREDQWLRLSADRPDGLGPYGAQTWVGDTLFVWGGVTPYTQAGGGGQNIATGALYTR